MRKKSASSKRASKRKDSKDRITIRGAKQVATDINKSHEKVPVENPIKRQIKLNQFPWTEKQKEFFKIALHPSTKIVFVEGPAGTSKTLLSVYCSLQLLNMKVSSDIMYLRSAVESSDKSLGFLPGSAEEKLDFELNLNLLEKNKGFAEGSGPKVDFPKVETDGFGEGATGGLGTQSSIAPTQGVEATVPAEKSIATNIKDYFVGPDSTVVPDTIAGVGTGMIMSQFQDEPEGGTRMGIVPAPPLVQAQGAYLQEVGPMMANVTGVPNFNNITQMANQSVYGVGTPNHLAGLYG